MVNSYILNVKVALWDPSSLLMRSLETSCMCVSGQSQLLALRSGVFVYACVVLCVGGGSGLRGDEKTHRPKRQLPQPCGLQRPPPRSHPTAQGNSCPAPLVKLPHAAVQRTLRHTDRSALTRALEESAPAARGRRGGGCVCPELMLFLLCTRCRDTRWRIINLIIIRPTADDSRTLKRSEIFIKNVL